MVAWLFNAVIPIAGCYLSPQGWAQQWLLAANQWHGHTRRSANPDIGMAASPAGTRGRDSRPRPGSIGVTTETWRWSCSAEELERWLLQITNEVSVLLSTVPISISCLYKERSRIKLNAIIICSAWRQVLALLAGRRKRTFAFNFISECDVLWFFVDKNHIKCKFCGEGFTYAVLIRFLSDINISVK